MYCGSVTTTRVTPDTRQRNSWPGGLWLVACVLLALTSRADAETLLRVPGSDLIGATAVATATQDDTLTDIGRRTGLGYEEMLRANPGIDPWVPGEGTEVVLPKRFILPAGAREGVIVNIAEYRLYYFTQAAGAPAVATFPVSIGRMDWSTPLGRHRISSKQTRPAWYPPESVRAEHAADGRPLPKVVPPGPDNPLGDYAMRLNISSYLIHGTNKPVGIGMQVTHGCIRMYPEDIQWLYPQIPVGTSVQIVNQPVKFGWAADGLYLEVHPALEGDVSSLERGMTVVTEAYVEATRERPANVDWNLVEEVYRAKLGIPIRVGDAVAPAVGTTAATL
ncbi:MAG: L,D-transpeptidase family protein [Gammaproteobacteria bacterium]|nr:MAG: L,D-transpeptidase family protein [Gammaproteobacteria bacterium]